MKNYYNKNFEPNYITAEQINSNVRRLLAKNPSAFTFYGTGTYIIGREDIAIIDPGPIIDSHIQNLLKITNKAKRVNLFITHTHADHSPAANIIKAKINCTTYGYGPYPNKKNDTQFEEGHDVNFDPDVYLKDGDIIKGKDWTIKAIHTPGHTSNHMCYGLEEKSILFSGDHVMGWSTTVIIPPDGDMRDYIESLKKILMLDYKIYLPTHGGPIKEPKKFVNALIGHRKMREQQILQALKINSLTIKKMVEIFYKNTDKKLWAAAEKSVLATLISLEKQDKVLVENNQNINAKWKLS